MLIIIAYILNDKSFNFITNLTFFTKKNKRQIENLKKNRNNCNS